MTTDAETGKSDARVSSSVPQRTGATDVLAAMGGQHLKGIWTKGLSVADVAREDLVHELLHELTDLPGLARTDDDARSPAAAVRRRP
jgi:hypothetical protein